MGRAPVLVRPAHPAPLARPATWSARPTWPTRPAYPTPATAPLKRRAADIPSPVGAASHPGDPMG